MEALNPLFATVELVSNATNIWFLGLENIVSLYVPVILVIKAEYLLPPS